MHKDVIRFLIVLATERCARGYEEAEDADGREYWSKCLDLVDEVGEIMKQKRATVTLDQARRALREVASAGPGLAWALADLKKVVAGLDDETKAAVLPAMRALEEMCHQR